MGDRAAFEKTVLKWVNKLDPSGENGKLLKEMFSNMSDKQIEEFVKAVEAGEDFIPMVYNNLKENTISVENNLEVAKEMGVEMFERLWLTDATTGRRYRSNPKYLIVDLPVRRQIQVLQKKMSVPSDNMHVDELTDQPSDVSKGSGVSYPELLVIYSQGLETSLLEFIKMRGGDLKAFNAMERQIAETGEVNIEPLLEGGTRVKSTKTLSAFFKAMHLDNNLSAFFKAMHLDNNL